ncbi:hypothetical protein CPB86DRAFT_782004 [Serendipita vermifera]|nr:hypothetical protein CPB86DRAFT_782004 [Serendipita vermifera]
MPTMQTQVMPKTPERPLNRRTTVSPNKQVPAADEQSSSASPPSLELILTTKIKRISKIVFLFFAEKALDLVVFFHFVTLVFALLAAKESKLMLSLILFLSLTHATVSYARQKIEDAREPQVVPIEDPPPGEPAVSSPSPPLLHISLPSPSSSSSTSSSPSPTPIALPLPSSSLTPISPSPSSKEKQAKTAYRVLQESIDEDGLVTIDDHFRYHGRITGENYITPLVHAWNNL